MKQYDTLHELIYTLGRAKALDLLLILKDGKKRWSKILEILKDKKSVSHRIRELVDLGLIQITIVHDTPAGTKYYELTPLGKKIVQLLEQIEKEFEEYHSKAPSKDPKKFINELLEDK